MRRARYLPLMIGAVLLLAPGVFARGGGEVKGVVDLALKALGGEERLAKIQGATWKG